MKKDLLKLIDLSGEEILEILDTADQLKYNQKHGIKHGNSLLFFTGQTGSAS